MASLDGVNLAPLDSDGLEEAIDEVVFGDDHIFFEEGSGLLPDHQPVEPSVVNSPQRTSPIAHFASLRPLSVDGLPPPSTTSGYASPASPTGLPHPASPTGLPHPSLSTGHVHPQPPNGLTRVHLSLNVQAPPPAGLPPPSSAAGLSHPDGSLPSVPHVRCRQIQFTVAIALRNISPHPLWHPLLWMSLTLVLPPFPYLGSNTYSLYLKSPQSAFNE